MKSSKKKASLKHPLSVTLLLLSVIAVMAALPGTALAYETAHDFRYPLDAGGWYLGQSFGAWNTGRNAYHLAEDLLPLDGRAELPVYAPANGYVRHSGYQSGYGYVLVIEHRLPDNTYVCSVLGHLKAANLVPRGAEVVKGQLVGRISANYVENGGYPFSHLHFGIRSGPYSTTRDPDGGWRYRGYAASTAIRALWHHPSNFVKAHSSPAPSPSPQTGSLRVTISPQEAVQAGARWRIAGTSTWRSSGETVSQIPAGSYTVEFRDVPGWDRPSSQQVTVNRGQVETISATYAQKQASPAMLGVSKTSLSFGLTRRGTYTPAQSYIVAGTNLSGAVHIQAPAGFWISTNPYSVSSFGRSITLQPRNGTVYQKIYVSFLPTRTGSTASYIAHSTGGAATKYVRVSGWGY